MSFAYTGGLRALIIGEHERCQIKQMIEAAHADPVRWEDIKHAAIADNKPVLKLEDRAAEIARQPSQHCAFGAYTAAFSYEEQPLGLFRHLSVSIGDGTRLPHPAAVEMLAKEFGFTKFPPGDDGRVWVEEFDPGCMAVNVIELAEPVTH